MDFEALKRTWRQEQQHLSGQVVEHDAVEWVLPAGHHQQVSRGSTMPEPAVDNSGHAIPSLAIGQLPTAPLRLVGGVDISFFPPASRAASTAQPAAAWQPGTQPARTGANTAQPAAASLTKPPLDSITSAPPAVPPGSAAVANAGPGLSVTAQAAATHPTGSASQQHDAAEHGIAALVVMTFPDLVTVYEDYQPLPLSVPYIPGFLAFREVPAYMTLLERVKQKDGGQWTPQVLLVDGCGILHPAACGSACHLGVVADIPTIGVAKNLLAVDGLDRTTIEGQLQAHSLRVAQGLAQGQAHAHGQGQAQGQALGQARNQTHSQGSSVVAHALAHGQAQGQAQGQLHAQGQEQQEDLDLAPSQAPAQCPDMVASSRVKHNISSDAATAGSGNNAYPSPAPDLNASPDFATFGSTAVPLSVVANAGPQGQARPPVMTGTLSQSVTSQAHSVTASGTLPQPDVSQFWPPAVQQHSAPTQPGGSDAQGNITLLGTLAPPSAGHAGPVAQHLGLAQQLGACVSASEVALPLVGASGRLWGAALTTASSKKPLYISTGHRISLPTALRLVSLCCRHRTPEPIRQADLRSRQAVRDALAVAARAPASTTAAGVP